MRVDARNARNAMQMQKPVNQQAPSKIQQRELPPKPGPKPPAQPRVSRERKNTAPAVAEGYALVPLADLPMASKGRYAVLPANEAQMAHSNSTMRLTRSQDDLDRLSHNFILDNEDDEEEDCDEEEESFMSLPAISERQETARKIASAFSTDFVNKSMILVDQTSMQRYAVVPTDDDEEVVDANHEIIQMHNGRAHRYAMIPTDEEETCLSGEFETSSVQRSYYGSVRSVQAAAVPSQQRHDNVAKNFEYSKHRVQPNKKQNFVEPQNKIQRQAETPTKNPIATQKLHELLSTPRKTQEHLQRHGSYHTIALKTPEQRYRSQVLYSASKHAEFRPQKLQYEPKQELPMEKFENRTTAVISPRLQQSIYNDTTISSGLDKTWSHESFQKVASATATIGIVSLMLLLTGFMNSGLCLYIVTVVSWTS